MLVCLFESWPLSLTISKDVNIWDLADSELSLGNPSWPRNFSYHITGVISKLNRVKLKNSLATINDMVFSSGWTYCQKS